MFLTKTGTPSKMPKLHFYMVRVNKNTHIMIIIIIIILQSFRCTMIFMTRVSLCTPFYLNVNLKKTKLLRTSKCLADLNFEIYIFEVIIIRTILLLKIFGKI